MQLHQIKPKNKIKKGKRVGRGGKRGTYSGRGIKGQKARAGHKLAPVIRELIKKHPKLKGYRYGSKSFKPREQVMVSLKEIDKNFKSGDVVSPKILIERGLVSKVKTKAPKIKILANGSISKGIIFKDCDFSAAARELVEKAGGKIEN
ncbi:MAG TPA: 50S ribosomal protein L15 [Candidatus Parcubacteria bacterium]|nr:50S ribosomal protein L15 [Candidatus Parcubacteria bacterium]